MTVAELIALPIRVPLPDGALWREDADPLWAVDERGHEWTTYRVKGVLYRAPYLSLGIEHLDTDDGKYGDFDGCSE